MKKSNFFCEFFVNKNIPILPKITKKCPHLGEGCQVAAPVKFCGGRLLRQSQLLYKSDLTIRPGTRSCHTNMGSVAPDAAYSWFDNMQLTQLSQLPYV